MLYCDVIFYDVMRFVVLCCVVMDIVWWGVM